MITIVTAVVAVILSYTAYSGWCLLVNYRQAKQLGAPLVVVPLSPDNQLWIAFQTLFTKYLRDVPWATFTFTKHTRLGWEYHDKFATHVRLGDPWTLVTPSRNWFYVTEASAITDINNRGKEFLRPTFIMEALNAFGPNLATAEGRDWQRQRKLTASYFNEGRSLEVWAESVRQASVMLQSWTAKDSVGTNSTDEDCRVLALHVLAYVGFLTQYPFTSGEEQDFHDAASMTYRDSLGIILSNVTIALVVPKAIYSMPFLPKSWRKVGWAIEAFRSRMLEQVGKEKELLRDKAPGTGSLISNLVRGTANKAAISEQTEFKPLTDAEILGNIFVFHFAGHDTSAITLSYGLSLLAANPEVQEWLAEEIQYVTGGKDVAEDDYSLFPKLQRCMAVMLETLRLYEPTLGTPRYTGDKTVSIEVSGRRYDIPHNWMVVPNLQSAHTHPQYWGKDNLVWRPQRWIETEGNDISKEKLMTPTRGSYFPWSFGLRSCPGIKFSQVEFVACLAKLFQHYHSEPVLLDGETVVQSHERVLSTIQNSNVELLLQMRDPQSIVLRWLPRDHKQN